MPSLLVTKNNGLTGPMYEDWDDAHKRRDGQVIAGQAMLEAFKPTPPAPPPANVKEVVLNALGLIWGNDCSIWMRYDGMVPNSFAIIEPNSAREDATIIDDTTKLRAFKIKLDYYEIANGQKGDPISKIAGSESQLKLDVHEDTKPGQKKDKVMNVTIPSDFASFNDQYLKDMTEDIESLPREEDVPYLLSSLTFRRCL